jgi:DNA-binding transcriptional ArsR family regulator
VVASGPMTQEALLEAVSSPRRREILKLVWDDEKTSGDITKLIQASWPSISRSLRELREAGVVHERREGQQRFYKADRQALRPLEKFLTQLWDTGLDTIAKDIDRKRRKR